MIQSVDTLIGSLGRRDCVAVQQRVRLEVAVAGTGMTVAVAVAVTAVLKHDYADQIDD